MFDSKSGHGEKASRKQEILICALLTEPTVEKAAKKTGIATTTAFRWLQESNFQEQYKEARRKTVSQAISQIQQASSKAVQTLRDVMEDTAAPPASRVNAAKATLELAFKTIEIEDLAQRIGKLEVLLQNFSKI